MDEQDLIFPEIPADFAALSDDELRTFVSSGLDYVRAVNTDPRAFITEEYTQAELRDDLTTGVEAIKAAKDELTAREALAKSEEPEGADDAADDDDAEDDDKAEGDLEADVAALAAEAGADLPEPVAVEPEPVVAAAVVEVKETKQVKALTRPARSAASAPQESPLPQVALTAAAGASDMALGEAFPDEKDIADAMIRRKSQFGLIPEGVRGEKVAIARASWSHLYPDERVLTGDENYSDQLIAAATKESIIRQEMDRRKALSPEEALVATGGLCAPVTPYYQLMMVSAADRPVRAALPSFNADRGGIRYAAPATLATVTASSATGVRTASQDQAGGTNALKTCAIVSCPNFSETDVQILYHCLQFGNLGARTFPERVAQWNNLTLAAHARLCESQLLTGIDAFSTQITAGHLGLGATAALLGQYLAAANALRSRHRMATDAVIRLLMPWWAPALMVSDTIRTQFQRFDTDEAKITALLRSFNIEPSFYMDSANGRGQVWGTQNAGALLPFPAEVIAYMYPEGSFLYLDGGTLELGLVRDSVLNSTNDFQIFGETFENVAYVGVESLAIESIVCDSGTVSLPTSVTCPVSYAGS